MPASKKVNIRPSSGPARAPSAKGSVRSRMNRRDSRALFPARPALIIVDMQNYFAHPDGWAYLPGSKKAMKNIERLRKAFRDRALPVCYTRHAHRSQESAGIMDRWWGELMMDGTWEAELAVEPATNEPVIRKERYSAFVATQLEAYLIANACDGVVVCGVMTHLCVETTLRDAFMRDYIAIAAADACATDSRAHHEASLANLAHGFALVLDVDDIEGLLP